MEDLLYNRCVQRICKFASSAFPALSSALHALASSTAAYTTYGVRNYLFMKDVVERVREWSDKGGPGSFRRPYDEAIGVFPCRTFNLSPQSVSTPHTDHNNLAQGWCSITPLGTFDPMLGGHLVLWDFGVAIQFPPGATALIPSALITHSNTKVQPGEVRYSIVQYASDRIFQWANNSNSTNTAWLKQATPQDMEARMKEQERRWRDAAASYSTLQELSKAE